MAQPKVDLKLGTSLVQIYDGTPENLNAFLDAVALFTDTVNLEFEGATAIQQQAANQTVLKFIKTRLTGAARQEISGTTTLEEIINKLREQGTCKINSGNIKAKLGALKQRGTVEEFCDQVEKLTLNLAAAYIEEEIPAKKAKELATKQGVDTLINGVSSNDIKLILKAGNFDKITDATQKVQECDQTKNTQAHVFMTKSDHPQRGRGRGRGRFIGGRRYNDKKYWQDNQQQSKGYNQHQHHNQRGRGNPRGWHGPRFSNHYQQHNSHSMYYANTDQQISQQQQNLNANIQQQNVNHSTPFQSSSNFLGTQFGQRTQ